MMPFQLENPDGLWALLALVPLIILYLIRPRPRPMQIPSLMFFLKSTGSRRLTSFLKQLTHDWLFLIQLLFLAALALTFMRPYTTYEHDITASNTVIVIDVSASSQVQEGSRTRFDLAVAQAKKVLGSKNSIILAKDTPYLALQDAPAEEASNFLNSLHPKDTESRIGEAIILAGEALGSEGRVVVISDFINTGGQDPDIAKAVLESKGIVVDFISTLGPKRKNIGIIQLDAGNDQTTVYVKNYNEQADVMLTVGNMQTRLSLTARGVETFSFKTPSGATKLELSARDDFPTDNIAYLSAPSGGKVRVLLIANNASTFLKNALLASGDFEVHLTQPPVIPREEFDVVILNNIDMEQVLPGTFDDIKAAVEQGLTLILAVQDDSPKIDYKGLLPVKLSARVDGGFINVEQLNRFTKNIDFGKANTIFPAEAKGEQTIIATVNGAPAITIQKLGSGKIIYYGIPEDADFKFSPHYPIFWTEFIKHATEQQDVKNLNLKTGETLILDGEQKVKTPSKTVKRTALLLDEAGIYELEDRILAVNLVSDAESNINLEKQVGTKSTDYELRPVKETRKFHWTMALLALALFFTVFEIFFIKYRGDL